MSEGKRDSEDVSEDAAVRNVGQRRLRPLRAGCRGRLWRLGRWAVVLGFGLAAICGVFSAVTYYRSKAALEAEVQRLVDAGEPVRLADFADAWEKHPTGPSLEELSKRFYMESPGEFWGVLEPEVVDDEVRPALEMGPQEYPIFREELPRLKEVLDEFVALAQGPQWRHPYDFRLKDPLLLKIGHAIDLRAVNRFLTARMLVCLHDGDTAGALDAVIAALDVTELLREDPISTCQFYRGRAGHIALDMFAVALREIEGKAADADSRLEEIASRLEEMERTFRLAPTMPVERASRFTTIDTVGGDMFGDYHGHMSTKQPRNEACKSRYPRWENRWYGSVFYAPKLMDERVFLIRTMSRCAEVIDGTGPEGQAAAEKFLADLNREIKDYPVCHTLLLFLNFESYRAAAIEYRQRLIAARWAIRVYRYREAHGTLPASLAEVAGGDATAKGLVSGEPLSYERVDGGFVIFDAGPSGERIGTFHVGDGMVCR